MALGRIEVLSSDTCAQHIAVRELMAVSSCPPPKRSLIQGIQKAVQLKVGSESGEAAKSSKNWGIGWFY